MKLVLCTGNAGKVEELRPLMPAGIEVISLTDAGLPLDLPETGDTLEANALQKARYAHERTGLPCLADDTGLEVMALHGAPGVLSARYAGQAKDPVANMRRLLDELRGAADRTARFRTVIAFVAAGMERSFEGVSRGRSLMSRAVPGASGTIPSSGRTGMRAPSRKWVLRRRTR
jgi:XTP/dITP diphosphohydrolase